VILIKPTIEIDSNPEIKSPDNLHDLLPHVAKANAKYLAPNTPVQIAVAEDRFHVFVAGKWHGWEYGFVPHQELFLFQKQHKRLMTQREESAWLVHNMGKAIKSAIQVNFCDWSSGKATDWEGWKHIDLNNLIEIVARLGPTEAQECQS
jgi:hypothetical protein